MATYEEWPRDSHDFTAAEVGEAHAGLFRRLVNGTPREGVLGAPYITAVPSSWKVSVPPFTYVRVSGGAVYLSGVSATEEVDINTAAGIPSGQARRDLICWDREAAELVYIAGTPAASPSLPSDGGLPRLAEVRVNSGDASTIAGQVSNEYAIAALVNGPIPQKGTVSKRNVPKGGVVNVLVTFDPPFDVTPNVQATPWGDARDCNVQVDTITPGGCTIRLGSMASVNRTLGAQWRAEI